jgi:UDP-N-acetylmuramate--alanine ligase
VAIVTNIDAEHLDHWGDLRRDEEAASRTFVENLPFYGFAAVCTDHPEVQALTSRIENRRLVTYGTNPQAEVRVSNIEMGPEGATFDIIVSPRDGEVVRYDGLKMPMAGHHNVLNATAAVAVARELSVDAESIRKGLASFGGVRRRFTTTGVANGIRVVDDYGHHPVEIAAVLKAARAVSTGKVIAVVQPHRYTRLRDLMTEFSSCFNDADTVIVADVYTAGEQPIEGVDRDHLVEGLKKFGHRRALPLESPAALPALIAAEAQSGDLVVLLGAGDITSWSYALPGQLEALAK